MAFASTETLAVRKARRTTSTRRGRADILRAATREFAARGFHGATTAEIARAAGVAQPLVHHHFGSKVGLWRAVLDDLFGELQLLQEGTLRDLSGLDLTARLSVLLRQFVLFTARRPELARIMVVEGSREGKVLDHLVETYVRPQFSVLVALLEEILEEHEATLGPVETHLLAFVILGASTHPYLVAGSAKRLFDIDVHSLETAQRHANLVVEVLFDALKARAARAGSAAREEALPKKPASIGREEKPVSSTSTRTPRVAAARRRRP